MPGEGSSDNLHRGELDLIEEIDRGDVEVDTFDDLISTVQNSEVAAAAASVRSARQQEGEKEIEQEEEQEEVAQDFFGLEFSGDMGDDDAAGGGGPKREYRTGGDDEESTDDEDDEPIAPVDESEQSDSTTGGHTWSTIAHAPAPPASSAPAPDPNSWVSPRDSEQE